jgi:hypothetical protein
MHCAHKRGPRVQISRNVRAQRAVRGSFPHQISARGVAGAWWGAAFGIRDSAFVGRQRCSEVGGENRVGIKALGIKA